MFVRSFWCLFLFVSICSQVSAQVVFNEIMYDVSGSDTGREWVEIQNVGVSMVSIATTTWKFVEADTKHSIKLERGSLTIPAQGFFVIVDNIDKFLNDWTDYYGTIFSSSFSLSNTGEQLTIIGDNGVAQDTVIYKIGDNHKDNWSLQKFGGDWRFSLPTPGSLNLFSVLPETVISGKDSTGSEIAPVEASFGKKVEGLEPSQGVNLKSEKIGFKKNDVLSLDDEFKVVATGDLDGGYLTMWLYRLGGIIILGLCAVFSFKPKSVTSDKRVDEFEILEE